MMRGEKCQCICPNSDCGKPLQARLGSGIENGGNEPHFSHGKYVECDVEYAAQTALHIMAKDILEKEQKVFIPPVTVRGTEIEMDGIPAEVLAKVPDYTYPEGSNGSIVECKAELEHPEPGFIPDVIATTPEQKYFIEIFVTHPVPPEKKEKVTKLRCPMLELDLSNLKNEEISRETLRKILMNPGWRAHWVFHPKQRLAQLASRRHFGFDPVVLAYERDQRKKEQERRKQEARDAEKKKVLQAKELENNAKWDRIWLERRGARRRRTW